MLQGSSAHDNNKELVMQVQLGAYLNFIRLCCFMILGQTVLPHDTGPALLLTLASIEHICELFW